MKIELKWINRNTNPMLVDIYRSDIKVVDKAVLGTKIASDLPNAIVTYADEDPTLRQGTTYWYTLVSKSVDGLDVFTNTSIPVVAAHDTGPGPKSIRFGNDEYGYYGQVSYKEMGNVSQYDVFRALNLPLGGGVVTQTLISQIWDKWSWHNQVYYVPRFKEHVYTEETSTQACPLFLAGGVNGDDQEHTERGSTVKQDARVILGDYKYRLKLPSAVNPDLIAEWPMQKVPTQEESEYSELRCLFRPLLNYYATVDRFRKVDYLSEADITAGSVTMSTNTRTRYVQLGVYANGVTGLSPNLQASSTGTTGFTHAIGYIFLILDNKVDLGVI